MCSDRAAANERLVRSIADAINRRDFDALDEMVSPQLRRHCAATPDFKIESLEQFKAFLHEDLKAVPDAQQRINVIFATDEMVAMHATYSGTQTSPMGPFPPSHKKVELPFVGILRIEEGRVAEIWVEWDNLSALSQLGHFPPK